MPLLLLLNPLRRRQSSVSTDGTVVVRNEAVSVLQSVVVRRRVTAADISATVFAVGSIPVEISGFIKNMPRKRTGKSILGAASTQLDLSGESEVNHRIWGDSG